MSAAIEIHTGVTAAGVPFAALPPSVPTAEERPPLLVTWHLMDPPRTEAAFAAALPLRGVPAWRVHLGMPWCGARQLPGGDAEVVERVRRDAVHGYLEPVVDQAVDEFPGALAELRERFPVAAGGPIGVVGGSLGGAVALRVMAEGRVRVGVGAVVNAAVRARSIVGLLEGVTGRPYPWTDASRAVAGRLDFVARAGDLARGETQPPLLVVSGAQDYPDLRTDAADLVAALRGRYADEDHVQLLTVPGLDHPLAEPPGDAPAPQLPTARVVDAAMTEWFVRHLTPGRQRSRSSA
ncbi:alpha/beta hydrolase family protein [Streptomyces avicenniae]|uniref:alpha/beta hydrolase family protein n=1 Tax=Streptomyces avicenniae TaxID=500153 RepID=UPI000AA38C2B|nr:prolyl oligopeptidase family serine peptidase [Streptomyces avicenniae]